MPSWLYYSSLWTLLSLVQQSTQCEQVGFSDMGSRCFVDSSFGTTLDYQLELVNPADAGEVPGDCGTLTIVMTAQYTGINNVVTSEVSPDTVAVLLPQTESMYFAFTEPYSNILDGSVVTMTGGFEFDGVPIGQQQLGLVTISKTPTIVSSVATITVTTSVTDIPSVSFSIVSVQATSTITPAPVTIATKTATKTVLTPGKTTTKTITITPAPKTIYKTKIITKSTTVKCIPPSSHKKRSNPFENSLLNRGQPAGSPEIPFCNPFDSPPITTVIAGTNTVNVVGTTYDVSLSLVTVTSTVDVTGPTPTVYSGVKTTITVTKPKPESTVTKHVQAHRQTKYVTRTVTITKTVLPYGKKTPPCTTKAQPCNNKLPKITGLGRH